MVNIGTIKRTEAKIIAELIYKSSFRAPFQNGSLKFRKENVESPQLRGMCHYELHHLKQP